MYGHYNEPVVLSRDCKAVLIPAGEPLNLPPGTSGYIVQALGGSFTIYVEGNLFRIAGKDADALGKEPLTPPEVPENASDEDMETLVWNQMKTCYDPEIPINIVDLGLVYRCDIIKLANGEREAYIEMTLTAPGCGMGPILVEDVREKVEIIPTIRRAQVELVFDPPWNQAMMSDEAKLQTGMF